jgi:uncharacterized membrane protein
MQRHRTPSVRDIGRFIEAGASVGLVLGELGFRALSSTARKIRSPGTTIFKALSKSEALNVDTRSVTIRSSRAELFAFWRDFRNLPRFFEHVQKIELRPDGRSLWSIQSTSGEPVTFETEIVSVIPDELIVWRSIEGAPLATFGRVEFLDAPGERGTRVSLEVCQGAQPRHHTSTATHASPISSMRPHHQLRRLKMLIETGEIATAARRKGELLATAAQERT